MNEVSKRLGIIGAGQLGGYLCQAAKKMGITTTILASGEHDGAIRYADNVLIGAFSDEELLKQLVANSDVITFEIENIPVESLQRLSDQSQVHVFPQSEVMLLLQNKALQKQWLVEHGFPTSHFLRFDDGVDATQVTAEFGASFVLKAQRGGYDGLGVDVVRNGEIPAGYAKVPAIAEALVGEMTELAVLVARDQQGKCAPYPLFESIFDQQGNVLRQVVCPSKIDASISAAAETLGVEVVTALGGVGIFAVELFLSGGELLVNEISPRVHNVGHLTIEASDVSQFEQHVRAVVGMPVQKIINHRPAVMNNLLYDASIDKAWRRELKFPELEGVQVHWYGKHEPRPLRKLGHITAVAGNVDEAAQSADMTLEKLREQV